MSIALFLVLLLLAWVLRTNAQDRKTYEKELEDELFDDTRGDS